jgi:DNA polymerase
MGSTAMESLTGLNSKISIERGKWKEVIVKNTNYNVIITFNPSYLLRVPENKKHSWEDLKKIKQKITELNLHI